MNRTTGVLVAIIIVLVGAVAFMLGQRGTDFGSDSAPEPEATEAPAEAAKETPAPEEKPKVAERGVRIGAQGRYLSACPGEAQVGNLSGSGDSFLSVRNAPTTDAEETARLGNGDVVYVCQQGGKDNGWLGIVYQSNGRADTSFRCGVTEPISTSRLYNGACSSGWVFGKYIVNRRQIPVDYPAEEADDAPYVEPASAPKQRGSLQVTEYSNGMAAALNIMLNVGERRVSEAGGKTISNGMKETAGIPKSANCTQTTERGTSEWKCSTTFTYEY